MLIIHCLHYMFLLTLDSQTNIFYFQQLSNRQTKTTCSEVKSQFFFPNMLPFRLPPFTWWQPRPSTDYDKNLGVITHSSLSHLLLTPLVQGLVLAPYSKYILTPSTSALLQSLHPDPEHPNPCQVTLVLCSSCFNPCPFPPSSAQSA